MTERKQSGAVRACPICGKPAADPRYQPFCSPRCQTIDLGRWLKGSYSIATDEAPEDRPSEEREE